MRSPITSSGPSTALFLLISLTLILTACKPPADRPATSGDTSLRLTATLADQPALGPAPLVVTLTDEGGEPIAGAAVEVVGDMTHAGMQPVIRTAVESEAGTYRADDFTFTMAGDWIITVTATTDDGRRVVGELLTTVPGR